MKAIVIGAGIGGLCAAIGLRRRGWQVTVLERAPRFGEVGAGLTLMANGLRGLDALGVGDAVRAAGRADAPGGTRTASGRWISRIDPGAMDRLRGTAALGIHRAKLHEMLRAALPATAIVTAAEVTAVGQQVTYRHGGVTTTGDAALVVAADGIDSAVRAQLWPGHPGPVHSGSTAWLGVTGPWSGARAAAISWGPGAEFGTVPLGDGRVYWFAAVNAPAGLRCDDAMAALRARFGDWHAPVPALLDATDPASVIRTDLRHLATPLPSYVHGHVALLGDAAHAMTPNLGQGANQAIEDAVVLAALCGPRDDVPAALAAYDRLRRPRSQQVARAAAQIGRLGQQLSNPVAVGLRNALMRMTPSRVALRSMARHADWTAPPVPDTSATS
ncbi:FAD-dependent oxidoreductase [Catellatospora methionotrophica]|uniref:FAD-dependent oxidoreductase n=1 Tax=Catellatospora methionotrophica TaxID=121620 RepID=A0A8J3PFC9_9ACTN|nr:FAD-dependent oxidoreductase [Catellatospora methionotrophica]GIG15092.1 FAD-dependent oxidoreductase [Catellatospora methionotrophica]